MDDNLLLNITASTTVPKKNDKPKKILDKKPRVDWRAQKENRRLQKSRGDRFSFNKRNDKVEEAYKDANNSKPEFNKRISNKIELNKNIVTDEPTSAKKPIIIKNFKPIPKNLRNDSDSEEVSEENEEDSQDKQVVNSTAPKNKGVISSLFTKNPQIQKSQLSAVNLNTNREATNGVDTSDSSFLKLGLDKVLTQYLISKFNINKPTPIQTKTLAYMSENKSTDLILQAQTGSGKTLGFLLPIVDRLIKASGSLQPSDSFKPSRSSGLLAVILSPTRELARQTYDVLEKLVHYPPVSDSQVQRRHWLVAGLAIGGDKKASEKSRLRKGVNILVATPGRFLDHLQNTKSVDVDRLKWIVLDEGDRFLELGLQQTLQEIFKILDGKAKDAHDRTFKLNRGAWFWNSSHLPKTRQTLLVSATLSSAVKNLANYTLTDPVHLSANPNYGSDDEDDVNENNEFRVGGGENSVSATPHQLAQRYIVVPAKLRMVTLTAQLISLAKRRLPAKAVVFMLTCEEVEFFYDLLTRCKLPTEEDENENSDDESTEVNENSAGPNVFFAPSSILQGNSVFKLHGNMDQSQRSGTFKAYSKCETGILLCTDVAARGLDIPNITTIIQYDAPTSIKDYVHRVGRTARLGRAGEATLFLLPSEVGYLKQLEALKIHLGHLDVNFVLKTLATPGIDYKEVATEYQNAYEKFVLNDEKVITHARKAYWSTIRAYATHPSSEKQHFHVKNLHLGHWAKSFGLRETPTASKLENPKASKQTKEAVPSYASSKGKRIDKGYFDPNSEFAASAPKRNKRN